MTNAAFGNLRPGKIGRYHKLQALEVDLKTDDNLQMAYSATASASIRFCAFAMAAEKEGYRQIAKLLRALAEAEKVQAINMLRIMGNLDKSSGNLSGAIDSKTYDLTQRYPAAIEQADKDGNPVVSTLFQGAVNTTKTHIRLLNIALDNIHRLKDSEYWVCGVCGFIDAGDMPVSCKNCGAAREKLGRTV
jgi:rubrerythrin